MTSTELSHYEKAAKHAKELSDKNMEYIASMREPEAQPSIFQKIFSRFGDNINTTISGFASMIMPIALKLAGVENTYILLANAALTTATAYLAKNDKTTAAGLAGTLVAMALSTFGVATPPWLITVLSGFTGFLAKDQKPAGSPSTPQTATP
jgi:hypothetical protein